MATRRRSRCGGGPRGAMWRAVTLMPGDVLGCHMGEGSSLHHSASWAQLIFLVVLAPRWLLRLLLEEDAAAGWRVKHPTLQLLLPLGCHCSSALPPLCTARVSPRLPPPAPRSLIKPPPASPPLPFPPLPTTISMSFFDCPSSPQRCG